MCHLHQSFHNNYIGVPGLVRSVGSGLRTSYHKENSPGTWNQRCLFRGTPKVDGRRKSWTGTRLPPPRPVFLLHVRTTAP